MPAIDRNTKGLAQSKSGVTETISSVQITAGLRKVAINAGGTGYTNGTQTLTLAGGTGTSATVSVEVVAGVVDSINSVLTPGAYTANPSSPNTPTGGGGTGCTLNLTMADGTLLVKTSDANGGGVPTGVTWGATNLELQKSQIADFAGGDSATVVSVWAGFELPTATNDVVVTWGTDPGERAIGAIEVHGINTLDKSSGNSQDDNTTPTSNSTPTTTADEEFLFGVIGTQGPDGDAAGTAQNSFTLGQRLGTTGGGAASNRTVSEVYRIVSAKGAFEAEKASITSRETSSIVCAFKFSTVVIVDDLTEIYDFDGVTGEIADGTVLGTSGQNNTDVKMEGTGSMEQQSKAVGVGASGVDLQSSTIDFTGQHIYTRTRSVDQVDVEALGGWRIRILDSGSTIGDNYSEWFAGGSDTTGRITTNGFITHCISVDEGEGRSDVGASAPTDDVADGVCTVPKQLSASGQNTFFVDKMDYGSANLTVTGGEATSPGTSDDLANNDVTNERGVFKNIGGVNYILIGLTIGDVTASTDSYFADVGAVWLFEPQNVSSTLYTVTFVGGTGTNSAIFGTEVGSGITAEGVAGNTFIASRQPFNIVATDADIAVEFYGCNFLNANKAGGTVKLEQANAKAVSCLFDACGPITIRNSAILRKCIITNSAAGATSAALDFGSVDPGTDEVRDITIIGGTNGILMTGTVNTTYNLRNIKFGNVTKKLRIDFDAGDTVTINILDGGDNIVAGDVDNVNGSTLVFVNAKSYTVEGIVAGTEVRICDQADNSELAGVESSSTSFVYNHDGTARNIWIILINNAFKYRKLADSIAGVNKSIQANQEPDPNYNNP